jgi:N-acetylmuramoyl-L-alanine amidase
LRFGAAVLLFLLPALPGYARVRQGDAWAREYFTKAERMREALNGRPSKDRSRHDYQRVIDAYRRVYFGSPSSSKADSSVVAVAELQVEMGRRFDDDQVLQMAVKQYEFLRREYPGSKYRFDALFTIGEIYKDDLGDSAKAKATFEEFLRRYPRSRLADDATQAIAELKAAPLEQTPALSSKKNVPQRRKSAAQIEAEKYQRAADLPGRPLTTETTSDSKASKREIAVAANDLADDTKTDVDHPAPEKSPSGEKSSSPDRSSRDSFDLPRVTGIRHWSTPDYTRVAIDVEEDVQFSSHRIDHPDRIFFDLQGTKLASTLVGKSFDVDDGFLKKIRVAQFKPEKARVVLEVDDLSDYDAFLLSNPSRLIIDIHGKNGAKANAKAASASVPNESLSDHPAVAKNEGPSSSESSADADEESDTPSTADASPTQPKVEDSKAKIEEKKPVEDTKPTVKTVKVGKGTVKKIIEAGDLDNGSNGIKKPVPRSVEDLRSDVPIAKTTVAEKTDKNDSDDELPLDTKPAPSRSRSKHKSSADAGDFDAREARPTAAGDRSLIRALGLKIGRIVIDPGHGGHDTGTIGPHGLLEKDLVVDVGRRLGKLLETRMGAEVVYTRKDDTFIPLETRTAIANKERADLFVSIHANSSRDPNARGVETYYLNFTSSRDAMEVAARENAVSEKSIYELGDLVKKIALKEKIAESHEFAANVQQALQSGLALRSAGVRDRGVKKAPFIVLIGANMPSILAEISFVSNPADERKLETSEYRQRIAESLYRGIAKYASGLSGVKVASRMAKNEGQ